MTAVDQRVGSLGWTCQKPPLPTRYVRSVGALADEGAAVDAVDAAVVLLDAQ